MGKEIICLDTSILIDYYRKKNKEKTKLLNLANDYAFAISVISKLEILTGVNKDQADFWIQLFKSIIILPLQEKDVEIAADIIRNLTKRNKIIGLKDILIASTAISHNIRLSTLNLKDFERIKNLEVIK